MFFRRRPEEVGFDIRKPERIIVTRRKNDGLLEVFVVFRNNFTMLLLCFLLFSFLKEKLKTVQGWWPFSLIMKGFGCEL